MPHAWNDRPDLVYADPHLKIDPANRVLEINGQPYPKRLPPATLAVLAVIAQGVENPVSREEIARKIWGWTHFGRTGEERSDTFATIYVHLGKVRPLVTNVRGERNKSLGWRINVP